MSDLYRLDQSTDYTRECLSDTRHEISGFFDVVTIDYEAAHEHAQANIANLSVDDIHAVVDAAIGEEEQ